MSHPMNFYRVALAVLVPAIAASAQCCSGAQHISARTASGDFRVEARSLGKLGGHGPYRFRFEFFERGVQGKWATRGTFEKIFDPEAKKHFTMTVVPSETGNGVYVMGPGEKDLSLYDREGQRLLRIPASIARNHFRPQDVQFLPGQHESRIVYPDGGVVRYRESTLGKVPGKVGGAPGWRISRLYLPLGLDLSLPVGARSDEDRLVWFARMLCWTPAQGERQAKEVRGHLLALQGEDHEDAERALVTLGLSSLPAIDAALKAGDTSPRLRKLRTRIWKMLCGHRAPQDNLTLLAGMLGTGDPRLVPHARSRLRAILPKETPIDGEWVFKHRRELAKAIAARRAKAGRGNGVAPLPKK